MMGNIEYRVIKGLLTAKPAESIDSVEYENELREDYTEQGKAEKITVEVPVESPEKETEPTVIRLSDEKK